MLTLFSARHLPEGAQQLVGVGIKSQCDNDVHRYGRKKKPFSRLFRQVLHSARQTIAMLRKRELFMKLNYTLAVRLEFFFCFFLLLQNQPASKILTIRDRMISDFSAATPLG